MLGACSIHRRAVLGRSPRGVFAALQAILGQWPSHIWGVRSNNGSEFICDQLTDTLSAIACSPPGPVPIARTTKRMSSNATASSSAR